MTEKKSILLSIATFFGEKSDLQKTEPIFRLIKTLLIVGYKDCCFMLNRLRNNQCYL